MMIRRAGLSAVAPSLITLLSPSPVVGQSNPSSSDKNTTQAFEIASRVPMQFMVDARRTQ